MDKQSVLITGANRGIGLQLAEQFAGQNWQVVACCRDPGSAIELSRLAEQHDHVEIHALEVTDYAQMAQLSERLKHRKMDILLSNAGVYGPRNAVFGNVDPADWRQVLEVNSIAPLMLAQCFVEQVAAGDRKLIAVISSKMGSIADNGSGRSYIYRSSKTAVNQVVKCMSLDLAGRGISVITLHPGWVKTDMGGPDAETTVQDSVDGLVRILLNADIGDSGKFIEFDGQPIPW